jgi:CheY-like chemotaxis protein
VTLNECIAAAPCDWAHGPAAHDPAAEQSRRVVILDDDPAVADVIARALRSFGCMAVKTSDPEAFHAAIDRVAPSHLIVDLSMPGTDGLAVMRALADRQTRARVIVTSGHAVRLLEAMRQAALALGLDVVGRLDKPFKIARLHDLMARPPARAPELRGSAPVTVDLDEAAVRAAIAAGELRLYLQSRVSCGDGRLLGYEALARWQHPKHDVVPPNWFVPLLEASGFEHLLAYRMLDLALAELDARGDPD